MILTLTLEEAERIEAVAVTLERVEDTADMAEVVVLAEDVHMTEAAVVVVATNLEGGGIYIYVSS